MDCSLRTNFIFVFFCWTCVMYVGSRWPILGYLSQPSDDIDMRLASDIGQAWADT